MSDAVLELAKALIERPSITPDDAGCQEILLQRLSRCGFVIERLPFGNVNNFWARRGNAEPVLVFAGHTDVVPPGPLAQWQTPPFAAAERDGYLYGRGAADMKTALAAMVVACEAFVAAHPEHHGSLALLVTSDEEGEAVAGTAKVIEYLMARNERLNWCVVGEASSQTVLGDTIKIGRRGSLSGRLVIQGQQGHIAYPQLADNPIHRALPALLQLTQKAWDKQLAPQFQPTSWQISNIHAGTGVGNVIPGQLELLFNFRYAPPLTAADLQAEFTAILDQQQLAYQLDWQHGGKPFITQPGQLLSAVQQAVREVCGVEPALSTSGGTSDGRFIAPTGCEVIELGVCNDTIHQVNECVRSSDLPKLAKLYERIMQQLLVD